MLMKKNVLIKVTLLGVIFLTALSCKKNGSGEAEIESLRSNQLKAESAKEQFAVILSKAIEKDADLREFIKNEALLQFDKDFDVFYPLVKEKEVSKGQTFKEKLDLYAENRDQLSAIESALPLLTIYIPTLPSGFSANSWDATKEIPLVSPIVANSKQSVFFGGGKEVVSLTNKEIPGFPTLVIKNNERVVLKDNIKMKGQSGSSVLGKSTYAFIDDAFNGTIKLKGDPGGETNHLISFGADEVKPELVNAFDIMGLASDKWQRDHIYYGLNLNANTEGPLNRRFRETIRSIRFTQAAMNKMVDQDDPRAPTDVRYFGPNHIPYWTDGNFEIKFDVLINNTAGLGTTLTKYTQINPNLIFNLSYTRTLRPLSFMWRENYRYIYTLSSISCNRYALDIPLVTWDLETNGTSWKIFVSEIDDQQTTTRSESTTTEYATNFSFNIGWGETTKKGLNFGASAKQTKTNSYSVVTQLNSDDLGTLELNFSDPVILKKIGSSNTLYDMYSVYNPYVELVIMPKAAY